MDKEIKRAKIFNYTVAVIFLLIFMTAFTEAKSGSSILENQRITT